MKKIKLLIGIFLILIGLSLYLNDLISDRKKLVVEKNQITNTLNNIVGYRYIDNQEIYDAVLSIPQINLKKGIYDINDSRNNIDENIMIDKHTIYPNTFPSNVILIAHSGIGDKAYFKNLEKLNTDSLIEFYYDHVKYVYKIDNFYYVLKNGNVKLDYDKNKKTITLITCSKDNKQVVYIGYLIDEVMY